MNKTVNSKALLICVIGFLALYIVPALASEVTGSLCTGVNCPVEGTVIAAPLASPAAGTYTSAQSVALTASGATSVRYTTDGTAPACPSTGTPYSSAISVGSSATIKAVACYANNASSTVASFAYTISIPVVTTNSNSGGGGGGSYVAPVTTATTTTTTLTATTPTTTPITTASPAPTTTGSAQNQLNTLIAQLQVLQNQAGARQGAAPSVVAGGGASFSRNLQFNSQGEDVRQLQIFLNSNGFPVTAGGAGSPGQETNLFGNATRVALAKYQASVGLPATGYLGQLTRTKIAGNITPTTPLSPAVPATPSVSASAFTRNLDTGMTGEDVKQLQIYLNAKGFKVAASGAGSLGNETTRFGVGTKAALARFQASVKISPAVGYFGSTTRAYVNTNP